MREETNFDQFEALLLNKTYTQLSENQRAVVSIFCDGEEAFMAMKKTALTSRDLGGGLPHPSIETNLLKHIKRHKAAVGSGGHFFNQKLPAWSLLLTALFFFLFGYFFTQKEVEIHEVEKRVIQTDTIRQNILQTDTIYIKQPAPQKKRPIAKAKQPIKKQQKVNHSVYANQIETRVTPVSLDKVLSKQPAKGRSLKQVDDLKKFIVRME